MNHIELFSTKQNKQQPEHHNTNPVSQQNTSRIQSKRPQNISVARTQTQYKRWRQCKIIGKNISIRSYSGACGFQKLFYVYGGYQILKGNMSDFYSIDLDDNAQKYNWVQIEAKGDLPGPRSKHSLIGGKQKIYLIGGLVSDVQSSNQIYEYHPAKNSWTLLKPEGQKLPQIDTFGCAYLTSGNEQKIIILCGYDGKNAEYLNSVYQYNITKNKLSILFKGTKADQKNENIPIPRSGCAAATDGKNIYLFGGKDTQNRLNDLWQFNLTDFKYRKMQGQGDIPPKRNGHSMQYHNGKLYVFGGIHDITWQLDDLHIYNLTKHRWTTLQQDSPRKVDRKKATIQNSSKDKVDKKSPKKKNWYETANTLYNNKGVSQVPSPTQKYTNTTYKQQQNINGTPSPGKMIDQQRKKAFLQRKAQMLRNFEVQKKDQDKYLLLETSSQAMKNSLDVIGDPNPKSKVPDGKLTDFGKETSSKFLQPLQNNSNLIYGKKPCARDGHCSVMLNNQLIIFGGDRHQMSFSDIFKLKFDSGEEND